MYSKFTKGTRSTLHHRNRKRFFMDEAAQEKALYQKALKSKYEILANINENKRIAVGSFNYHDDFFGKRFNITFKDGMPIKTSCAGFGLERFTYAYLCQKFKSLIEDY